MTDSTALPRRRSRSRAAGCSSSADSRRCSRRANRSPAEKELTERRRVELAELDAATLTRARQGGEDHREALQVVRGIGLGAPPLREGGEHLVEAAGVTGGA